MTKPFLACDGHLPARLPVSIDVVVDLIGCAVPMEGGDAEFLLVARHIESHKRKMVDLIWGVEYRQHRLVPAPHLTVGGRACREVTFLQHAVRFDCNVPAAQAQLRYLKLSLQGNESIAPKRIQLKEKVLHGSQLVCDARVPFGDIRARRAMMAAARKAWAQVGFETTMAFSRVRTGCARLEELPGISCDVRSPFDVALDDITRHAFDETPHRCLCLAYARASGAALLALADTDDFPATDLPVALRCAAQQPKLAAFRLFFDANRRCPDAVCPLSINDLASGSWIDPMTKLTVRGGEDGSCAGACDGKACWKPIVIPSHVHDVSVHWAIPKPGFRVQANVWGVCLHHQKATEGQWAIKLPQGAIQPKYSPRSGSIAQHDTHQSGNACKLLFGGWQASSDSIHFGRRLREFTS